MKYPNSLIYTLFLSCFALVTSGITQKPSQKALPGGALVKLICFDIGSVLLRMSSTKIFWMMLNQSGGTQNVLSYLIFDPNRFTPGKAVKRKVYELFDHLATTEGVPLMAGRYPTEKGHKLAASFQEWQTGRISDEEVLKRVLKGLDSLSYSSPYEKKLSQAAATIILTPELHVKTKKKIKGMEQLVAELKNLKDKDGKPRFTLVITSNIDKGLAKQVQREFKTLFNQFDAFYGSADIGVMKPDPQFFKHVINQHGVQPHEVLVIDDLPENLSAAKKDVGCRTFQFNNNVDQLRITLEQLGVLSCNKPTA